MPLSWCANADERLQFAAKSPVLKNCRSLHQSLASTQTAVLFGCIGGEGGFLLQRRTGKKESSALSVPKFVVSKQLIVVNPFLPSLASGLELKLF